MNKTLTDVREEKLQELKNVGDIIVFAKRNVIPILERFDGKKVNKRITTAIKKELLETGVYIGDLQKTTSYDGDILEASITVGFREKHNRTNYNIAILVDRDAQTLDYGKTLAYFDKQDSKNRDSLMKLARFDETCAVEVAKKLDSLIEEYISIVDELSYEQKVLVGRKIRRNKRWIPSLGE